MAIKVSAPKRNTRGLSRLITMVVFIIFLLGAAYALFFAPKPAFDYIASPSLERNRRLANFEVDPQQVLSSEAFQRLRLFGTLQVTGSFGRSNPFTR